MNQSNLGAADRSYSSNSTTSPALHQCCTTNFAKGSLDYIFEVNTKIDAKLSRHFRDMERVYAVIARAAAKRRQWEEEESEQGPHVYLQPRCTPWRTTWNGMASIGPGDSITESTQPSKQKPRPRIGFI